MSLPAAQLRPLTHPISCQTGLLTPGYPDSRTMSQIKGQYKLYVSLYMHTRVHACMEVRGQTSGAIQLVLGHRVSH